MAERTYPVRIVRDVLIPMRDGIHLAGNLYLPEGAGPVPGILEYTPYLKDGHGGRGRVETAHLFFARRGYACLTLDMRGFGASEGVAAPPFSASEKSDGHAALAWMAAQPWCSGRTAMWGVSYGGDTALSVASTGPPSLEAIVPIHATDDEFSGLCYPHGCRQALWGEIDWGLRMLGLQLLPPLRFGRDRRSSERPSRLRVPVAGLPERAYAFQPPHDEAPEALVFNRADHAISRDLLGRTAEHRQQRRAVYRLEGGAILRMDLDTRAAIDAHSPGEVSLQGTWTLTVERPVNTVVVRAEAIETFDHLRLAAEITLDGRPFYRRAWDLDLRQAAWSLTP